MGWKRRKERRKSLYSYDYDSEGSLSDRSRISRLTDDEDGNGCFSCPVFLRPSNDGIDHKHSEEKSSDMFSDMFTCGLLSTSSRRERESELKSRRRSRSKSRDARSRRSRGNKSRGDDNEGSHRPSRSRGKSKGASVRRAKSGAKIAPLPPPPEKHIGDRHVHQAGRGSRDPRNSRPPVPFDFIVVDHQSIEPNLSDLTGIFELGEDDMKALRSRRGKSGAEGEKKTHGKRFNFPSSPKKKNGK